MEMNDQIEREIALKVLKELFIATPTEIYEACIYKDGVYREERNNNTIKRYIHDIANEITIPAGKDNLKKYNLSISRQNMILDFIKTFTSCSLDDFDSNERIINTKNGLYFLDGCGKDLDGNFSTMSGEQPTDQDIKTTYFMTHEEYILQNKEPYKSFVQIPINYDPTKENLEIEQVFTDVFGFDTVPLIYEMMGYLLLPHTKYSKGFMFYGETGTGKTTALNIITRMIGYENISGIELQLLDDKFELEKTRNRILNLFDDLSSRPIEFVGNFKKLVTNTYLYGRIKHVQAEVRWKNRCKGVFACNVLPHIKEYVTDAFYTRWVLIPCFNDMKEKGIRDTKIREKQWSNSEMSGLFNKVIEAIKRLEDRNGFPEEWQDIEFVKNYWNMDINPSALFIDKHCDKGEYYEVDYNQFYKYLNEFRIEKRCRAISKTFMTKSLIKMGILKEDRGSRIAKEERFIFKGIQFNSDFMMDHLELEKDISVIDSIITGENI